MRVIAVELGAAYISILPSTKGFGAALNREIGPEFAAAMKRAEGQMSQMGAAAAKALGPAQQAAAKLKNEYTALAKAAEASSAAADKAGSASSSAAGRAKKAKEAEGDAARKLAIAEKQLEEIRGKSGVKQSQIMAAEDRLTRARQAATAASGKSEAAAKELAAAQADVQRKTAEAAQAQEKAKGALSEYERAAEKAGKETDQLGKEMADTDGKASKMGGAFGKLGGVLKTAGIGAALAGITAAGATLFSGIKGASSLEQSIGGVGAVFGKDAAQIETAAKNAATSMGLSRNAYNELATVVGAGLKNKGIKDYAGETERLMGLGADLAAQFGGSTQEAMEAISSLMRGETDPIEKYGIAINETAIKAELAARGQDKLTGAALETAKAQARVDILFRQSADAQGAFARESDTFAGKQQRAAAQWEDLTTKIGGAFLPVLSTAMGFLSDKAIPALEAFGVWASAAWKSISAPGDGNSWLAALAAQVAPAVAAVRALAGTYATQLAPILQRVGDLFVTVIAPALAALWQSIQTNVIPAFVLFAGKVGEVVQVVGSILGPIIDTIVTKFQELSPQINAAMTQVGQIIGGVMEIISTVVGVVLDKIRWLWAMWGDNILALIRIAMDTIMGVIRGVMTVIQGVINVIMGVITGDWSRAWTGIKQIFDGLWQVIISILRGAVRVVWEVIKMAFDVVRGIFENVTGFLAGLWSRFWDGLLSVGRSILASVSGAIDAGLNGIKGFFQSTLDGIRMIWDGLKAAASAPVRFVIDTVINNGIIKGWNDLAGLLKLNSLKLDPIRVPGFARGGVLPGPGRSAGDDMVVMDRHGIPRATVASGEPVISRDQYARNRGVIDSILRGGTLPGFFQGGRLPTPGPVRPHGLPYYGARYAADMGLGTGSPVYAWNDGTISQIMYAGTSYGNRIRANHGGLGQTLYAHLSRILVSAGQAVTAGQKIGEVGYSGNVRPAGPGGAHLHFEILGGNAPINASAQGDTGGGGLFDMAGKWITDKLSAPVKALLDKIPGSGLFTDAAKGMGTRLLDAAADKIRALIPGGSDSGNAAPSTMTGNTLLPQMFQIAKSWGLDRRIAHIMGITMLQEASGRTDFSPDSNSDVGIFQQRTPRDGSVAQLNNLEYAMRVFLYGRKATPGGYHVPGLFNKNWQSMGLGQAAQAVQVSAFPSYYNKHIPTVERMLNEFGYAGGTVSATAGWHLVGERGPELMRFRGGEQVADSPTSKEVLGSMGKAKEINLTVQNHDPSAAAARVMDELRWAGVR